MEFTENPYYNPEKCGLEIFDSIDTAGSYEFDLFVIWRKLDDNTLWWDSDAGCSCPSLFDNGDNGNDLKPITNDTFHGFDEALKNHYEISAADYKAMKKKVKDFLKAQ